jgi:hypothetical protein
MQQFGIFNEEKATIVDPDVIYRYADLLNKD